MNFSNQIHPPAENKIQTSYVLAWMRRNWKRYVRDGSLDAEAMAEQAAWEFCCSREVADELAVQIKDSFANRPGEAIQNNSKEHSKARPPPTARPCWNKPSPLVSGRPASPSAALPTPISSPAWIWICSLPNSSRPKPSLPDR